MSWSDRLSRFGLVFALVLPALGCLKPMYSGVEGVALQNELAAIAIDPIPERTGHYLGNELRFLLNGTGSEVKPKYRLQITLRERVQASLVDSSSQRASAGSIIIDADYKLVPLQGGTPIAKGVAFTFASAGSTKCTNSRPGFNRAWMAPTYHHSQPQQCLVVEQTHLKVLLPDRKKLLNQLPRPH